MPGSIGKQKNFDSRKRCGNQPIFTNLPHLNPLVSRHWLLRHFPSSIDVDGEMSFTLKQIMEDPRNNSAWNYRYSLLQKDDAFGSDEKMSVEIK